MNLTDIMLSENGQSQKLHTVYDSIYIKFLKSQDDRNGEDINGCPELGMLGREDDGNYIKGARGIFVVI